MFYVVYEWRRGSRKWVVIYMEVYCERKKESETVVTCCYAAFCYIHVRGELDGLCSV